MNILEFIRKNSLLVIIVIGVVGLGLVMMDYSGKGNMLSGDFCVRANGRNYSYVDVINLGENAEHYMSNLYSSSMSKLRTRFDSNQDESLSDEEMQKLNEWMEKHPEQQEALRRIETLLNAWSYGYTKKRDTNIAINRIILRQTADELGIHPSKEQVDAYLKALPLFQNEDGSFDRNMYQRLCGARDGVSNDAQENSFRELIADMITWECVQNLLCSGIKYNSRAENAIIDVQFEKISGKYARLDADKLPTPAAPGEEEIKTYWEQNKDRYKSEERRIVSVYSMSPAEGSSLQDLAYTAEGIMESVAAANGRGVDDILASAAENEEYAAFSFKTADGKNCETYELCPLSALPEALKREVNYKGKTVSLGQIAFEEVESAPSTEQYNAAQQSGSCDNLNSIQQYRGFLPSQDGKLLLIRVDAIESPSVLPYESAKEAALADLNKERHDNALADAAKALYEKMEKAMAEGGMDAAMAQATEAGAMVESFGPVSLSLESKVPEGVDVSALISGPCGKLCPLSISNNFAVIATVAKRSIEDSPEYSAVKNFQLLPMQNLQLEQKLLRDWLHSSYDRYKLELSDSLMQNN